MTKYCVIPEEVRFDIEMQLFDRFNSEYCNMYEYLGDIYSKKDLRDLKEYEKSVRKWLISDYLEGITVYTEEDIKRIREYLNSRCK